MTFTFKVGGCVVKRAWKMKNVFMTNKTVTMNAFLLSTSQIVLSFWRIWFSDSKYYWILREVTTTQEITTQEITTTVIIDVSLTTAFSATKNIIGSGLVAFLGAFILLWWKSNKIVETFYKNNKLLVWIILNIHVYYIQSFQWFRNHCNIAYFWAIRMHFFTRLRKSQGLKFFVSIWLMKRNFFSHSI